MISYMFGANVDDLDQVVDYMMDSEIEEQVSKEDVFNLMESNREKNLANSNNAASDSLAALFITQLMAFKYVFDLDYSDSDVT